MISGGEEGSFIMEGGGNRSDGGSGGSDGTGDEHERGGGGGREHGGGGGGEHGGGGAGAHTRGGGIFGAAGDPGQILCPQCSVSTGGRTVGGVITATSWSSLNLRDASPDSIM